MIKDIRLMIFLYFIGDLIDPVIVHCCEYNKSDLLPEF